MEQLRTVALAAALGVCSSYAAPCWADPQEPARSAPRDATAPQEPARSAPRDATAPQEPAPSAPRDATAHRSWTEPTWHALGLMSVMRLSAAALWPEPFAETDVDYWLDSYGVALREEPKWDSSQAAFEWDGDPWPINVVGHSLFGSELYLRPRICQQSPLAAALFTAGGAVAWEYGFEANAVQPSVLDLWFTPLAGVLLGELRFQIWRAAGKLDDPIWRGVLRTTVDPFGQVERAFGAGC